VNRALLALLVLDGALLGAFGLVFTPLYYGPVPVPMGALLSALILPWLVARAGEIESRTAVAAAPLLAWLLVVVVIGFWGSGGDVLLPASWQSLLLLGGGVGSGLWALRGLHDTPTPYGRTDGQR
jgi:hypothetical protein